MVSDPHSDTSLIGLLQIPATNLVSFIANETIVCGLTQRVLKACDLLPSLLAMAESALVATTPSVTPALKNVQQHATTDAAFAKEEIANGFATVLSHHAVAMWAGIETATEQTLINLIRKVPDAHDVIVKATPSLNVEKVKTKTSNDAKKAKDMWRNEVWKGDASKHSFDRELAMLAAFGVNVALTRVQRQALIEMSEVRNVLVHSGGFVDEKMLTKLPWLKLKAGQQLKVTAARMENYIDAAHAFTNALLGAVMNSAYIKAAKKPA